MTSRDSGALRRGILLSLPYRPYFPLHGRFLSFYTWAAPGPSCGEPYDSAPNAAFRVDRSPSLCSVGRFDIIELLHGDLHRLRHPQGPRHSPKASRPRSGEWSPRPVSTASGPRSRFVRPARPSTVPTAAAGGWIAAESALERLQGLKIAHFHLKALP